MCLLRRSTTDDVYLVYLFSTCCLCKTYIELGRNEPRKAFRCGVPFLVLCAERSQNIANAIEAIIDTMVKTTLTIPNRMAIRVA